MDETHVQVSRVPRKVFQPRDPRASRRIDATEPKHPDLAYVVGFFYALRNYYRWYGIRVDVPSNKSSSSEGKESHHCALLFDGKTYVFNDHNLAVLRTPRRVVDFDLLPDGHGQPQPHLPPGCTNPQCMYYCRALDGKNLDPRNAKLALPVALWVLNNLQTA